MTGQAKQLSEYTDREVIEIAARKATETAASAKWMKNYIIAVSVIVLLFWLLKNLVSLM